MQDNDFEKQVHQKMEALKLLPSEAVWEQVEMRLHRKEKRRRWIIWFPLMLAGLWLFGYITFYSGHSNHPDSTRVASDNLSQKKINLKNISRYPVVDSIQTDNKKAATIINDNLQKQSSKKVAVTHLDEDQSIPDASRAKTKQRLHPVEKSTDVVDFTTNNNSRFSKKKSTNKISSPNNPAALFETLKNKKEEQTALVEDVKALPGREALLQGAEPDPIVELKPANINKVALTTGKINTSLLTVNEDQLIKITKQYPGNGWNWGITLQAGRSSLANGTFNKIFSAYSYLAAAPNQSTSNGGLSNVIHYEAYPTRASAGFTAGVFVRKKLSQRFAFSIGLDYTFYSTTNTVGKKVDSVIQSSFAGNLQTFDQYFRAGNTGRYTNKYHYIEVPVLLRTTLTKNWKLPVRWDLGFSISKLIASNALHFDNITGAYFKDNQLVNKTQFNFITGLPVQLSSKKRFELQAGPQLQYGFSRVDSKDNSAKHFLFLGLKASLVIGKNKK